MTSPEWAEVQFEEALATFYADTGLYSQVATAPHSCLVAAAACPTGGFNIEESHQTQCAADENRYELSVERYLWDAYDSNVDYTGETLSRNNYEFFDTINAFPRRRGESREQRTLLLHRLHRDLRLQPLQPRRAHAADFKYNWSQFGTDSSFVFANNCAPVGD